VEEPNEKLQIYTAETARGAERGGGRSHEKCRAQLGHQRLGLLGSSNVQSQQPAFCRLTRPSAPVRDGPNAGNSRSAFRTFLQAQGPNGLACQKFLTDLPGGDGQSTCHPIGTHKSWLDWVGQRPNIGKKRIWIGQRRRIKCQIKFQHHCVILFQV
jgi:hypothetical protein